MSHDCLDKIERQRDLLSHVFHLISQPMTALQCSLEFALNAQDDPRECRTWLEAALENSERLRCRLSLAREMVDADDPVSPADTVELRSALQQALNEVEPLFETCQAAPQLSCPQVEVAGDRSRLMRAFLYLLAQLSASNAPASYTPELRVQREGEWIEVRFLRFVLRGNSSKGELTSQLEIAKKIFESAGGGLVFFSFPGNDAFVRVFLRVAQAQLDLYGEATKKKPAVAAIGTEPRFSTAILNNF